MSNQIDRYQRYNPIGDEEIEAVNRVMKSGTLSSFIGAWCDDFYGGKEVQAFENEITEYFGCKHAITFNSLTSGLIAAVGSIGISPGDEVIVSPWTMSATATAIVIWGGIPVFCDIETETYGLDPACVKKQITEKTKAIIVTDIFGHGSRLEELSAIASDNNLKLIEDVAQAPGILYKNKYCGTWGDIGGFSLNYHKHIHTGEGGFCITDDDDLALRMQLIRNHAESCIEGSPHNSLLNMVGFNFRLGEMEAAIGRCQLRKLDDLVEANRSKVEIINNILSEVNDFELAVEEENSGHAYYVMPVRIKHKTHLRDEYIDRCNKAGIPGLMQGYVNVHRLPMYQEKVAFGGGYPWTEASRSIDYGTGTCPVAEELKDHSFFGILISMYDLSDTQSTDIANKMVDIWKKMN